MLDPKRSTNKIMAAISVLVVMASIFFSACTDKTTVKEAKAFITATEALRPLAENVSEDYLRIVNRDQAQSEDPEMFRQEIQDLDAKVRMLLERFKAFKPKSPEVKAINDAYVEIWESYHHIITELAKAHALKDEKLFEMKKQEFEARAIELNEKMKKFQEEFKNLVKKHRISTK